MLRQNRFNKKLKLDIPVREHIWLWDSRHGVNTKEIASREGVSIKKVRSSLARARSQESRSCCQDIRRPPRLVPLFPIGQYTPQTLCGHQGPIERGSVFCCMVCHTSGQDDHPALQNDSHLDLSRRANLGDALSNTLCYEKNYRETRKQRRQRLFGAISQSPRHCISDRTPTCVHELGNPERSYEVRS